MCSSVVVVVRRFGALIPWSFGDTCFLFVFKLHNLPCWRLLCALFVFFLMISKFAFGQGMYVCSSSLCWLTNLGVLVAPSINMFPPF